MPRKDRRFTGEDVKRLYCRNLTPTQRYYFDMLVCDWDDYSPLEKTTKLIEALYENGLIDEVANYIPRGALLKDTIGLALVILKGGDLSQIDYVPISFLDQLGGVLQAGADALEELGGTPAFQGVINDMLEYLD